MIRTHREPRELECGSKRLAKWTAEGAFKGIFAEYHATRGLRKWPEVCWYLAESADFIRKTGWHRE